MLRFESQPMQVPRPILQRPCQGRLCMQRTARCNNETVYLASGVSLGEQAHFGKSLFAVQRVPDIHNKPELLGQKPASLVWRLAVSEERGLQQ